MKKKKIKLIKKNNTKQIEETGRYYRNVTKILQICFAKILLKMKVIVRNKENVILSDNKFLNLKKKKIFNILRIRYIFFLILRKKNKFTNK